MQAKLTALLVVTAVPIAGLGAAPASDAAPKGFYGMNWDRQFARADHGVLTREWTRMRRVGVQSVRTVFRWAEAQQAEGVAFDFAESDLFVAEAARRNLALLPVILSTPRWARKYPDREGSPPRDPREAARYLVALAERYGPAGTFWLQSPTLPKRPIRDWQMWNEPELRSYWNEAKFWKGYSKVIKASYTSLKRVDPKARLVLAGSVGRSWESLDRLYKSGLKGYFDVVAIHPYTSSVDNLLRIVRLIRQNLYHWRERKKPIWITEMSWPASEGRMEPPDGLKTVVTSDEGMAARLGGAYRELRERHSNLRYRVERIYWYTWASTYAGHQDVFDYAGLVRLGGDAIDLKPAFRAYRRVAR